MLNGILDQDDKIEIVTIGGHRIILDDGADNITILTRNGDSKIELNDSKRSIIMECYELQVRANGSIRIEAGMAITVSSQGNVTLRSQGSLEMKASATVTIKGAMVNIN